MSDFLYRLLLRLLWIQMMDPSEGGRYQVVNCYLGKRGPMDFELVVTRAPVECEWS